MSTSCSTAFHRSGMMSPDIKTRRTRFLLKFTHRCRVCRHGFGCVVVNHRMKGHVIWVNTRQSHRTSLRAVCCWVRWHPGWPQRPASPMRPARRSAARAQVRAARAPRAASPSGRAQHFRHRRWAVRWGDRQSRNQHGDRADPGLCVWQLQPGLRGRPRHFRASGWVHLQCGCRARQHGGRRSWRLKS